MSDELIDDYDSPWKEALELFFEPFLKFFFPAIHAAMDWNREIEFLDKELQEISPGGESGRRTVDKLVKAWFKTGEEQCLFLHAEMQGYREKDFPLRVYICHHRIFDKKRLPVVSMVVLMDDSAGNWCEPEFGYSHFGCQLKFTFPMVKLHDLRAHREELERSDDPMAIMVLAHLKTQDTRGDYDRRLLSRLELAKILLERGYPADVRRKLLRLMEWLLNMPDEYKVAYRCELERMKEENTMPFVDTLEEIAIEKGIEKGKEIGKEIGKELALHSLILENLNERFGPIPQSIEDRVNAVKEHTQLRRLSNASITAVSLSDFESRLAAL